MMTALDKLIVNMYGDYTPTDAERAELLRRCAKVVAEATGLTKYDIEYAAKEIAPYATMRSKRLYEFAEILREYDREGG